MLDGGDLGSHTVVPLIYCGASETQLPYPTARHVCTLLKSCSQLVILQLDCGHFTQGQCITTEGPISEKCLAEGRVFIFSLDLHRLRYVRGGGGSIAKDTVVYAFFSNNYTTSTYQYLDYM